MQTATKTTICFIAMCAILFPLVMTQTVAAATTTGPNCATALGETPEGKRSKLSPILSPDGVLNEFDMVLLYKKIEQEFKGQPLSLEALDNFFTSKGIPGITHLWRKDKDHNFFQEVWVFPKSKPGAPVNRIKEVRIYASGLFETAAKALRPQDELRIIQAAATKNNIAIIFAPSRGHGATYVVNEYQKTAVAAQKAREAAVNPNMLIANAMLSFFPKSQVAIETRFTPEQLQEDYKNLFIFAAQNIKQIAAVHQIEVEAPVWSFAGLSYGGWLMSSMLSDQALNPSLFAELKKVIPDFTQPHFKLVLVSPGIRPTGDLTLGPSLRKFYQDVQDWMNSMSTTAQGDKLVHKQLVDALESSHPGIMKSDHLRSQSTAMLVTGILSEDTAANIVRLPKGSEVLMVVSGIDDVVAPAQYYSAVQKVQKDRPDLKFQVVVLEGVKHQSTARYVWEGRPKQLAVALNLDGLLKNQPNGVFNLSINGNLTSMDDASFRSWAVAAQKNWWYVAIDNMERNDKINKGQRFYHFLRSFASELSDDKILKN